MSPPRRKLLERRSSDDAAEYRLVPTSEQKPPPQTDARTLHKRLVQSRVHSREQSRSPSRPAHPPNRKEALLESILHLSDEDTCWIISHVLRARPSLDPELEKEKRKLQLRFHRNATEALMLFEEQDDPELAIQVNDLERPFKSPLKYNDEAYSEPVFQFLAPMFYTSEEEDVVRVQVLRTGRTNCRSSVRYRTSDQIGGEGKVYKSSSGVLIFETGELMKDISVELIDDSNWNPSREFQIELLQEGLVNAKLEKYLWHTRVLVVDDDPFPTGKYKDFVKNDQVDEVPNLGLVIEYIKMQWCNEKIRQATKKIIAADMVDHLDFLLKALLQMYLVDTVLNVKLGEDHLLLVHHRITNLACVALVGFAPRFLLHYLELKQPFGVGSESRKLLMKSLFGRFLNFNPAYDLSEGDLLMAMSRDSLDVVAHIYRGVLDVMEKTGKIMIIVTSQFVAPLVFHSPIRWITIIPLCLFPVAMLIFLYIRDHTTTHVLFERLKEHDALVEFVAEAVQHHTFINECNARTQFLDHCEEKINAYHAARKKAKQVVVNNRQFAKWLSRLILAFYTFTGGMAVISGQLRLGLYITNLKMFEGMGKIYSDIYLHVLSIQQVTPGLKRLVRLLNVPTDLHMRAEMSRHRHVQADRLFTTLSSGSRRDEPLLDQLQIHVRDVSFRYEHSDKFSHSILSKIGNDEHSVNFQGELRLSQGQLVELIGPHGEGKTTLLKIIGGVLLPKLTGELLDSYNPFFFIPPHLNSIYVPSEPVFFRASLFANLTISVRGESSDGSHARVAKVCSSLGLGHNGEVASLLDQDKDSADISWLHGLSHAERALLSLARALIANPQLLCVERHWMGFDGKVSMQILALLRQHVDGRGIEQVQEAGHVRRPRTCVMTGVDQSGKEHLDWIYNVSRGRGIEVVHRR